MKELNTVDSAVSYLLFKGKPVESDNWQGVSIKDTMVEVRDLFFKMPLYADKERLAKATKADLPWAEDHFQERLAGPSNPGKEYKNWPYYRENSDNERFRATGKFSHTYQERFWSPYQPGIRFHMGDYNDIKDRLFNNPTTRQAFLAIWHPEDQSNEETRRLPCTIGYWFKLDKGALNITYLIRSCDASRHFRNDIYMTNRLVMDMADHLGSYLGEMSVWIGSFHYFKNDEYFLKRKIKQR